MEQIDIYPKPLKKVIFHSLIHATQFETFRMVLGMFGGKLKNDKNIIYDSLIVTPRSSKSKVEWGTEEYSKLNIYDNQLYEKEMFVVGWYCSISNSGLFFNDTNRINHIGYQFHNAKSFVLVIYPEDSPSKNFQDIIKAYRLKDIHYFDFSENAWEKLDIHIIDREKDDFKNETLEDYNNFIGTELKDEDSLHNIENILNEWKF